METFLLLVKIYISLKSIGIRLLERFTKQIFGQSFTI